MCMPLFQKVQFSKRVFKESLSVRLSRCLRDDRTPDDSHDCGDGLPYGTWGSDPVKFNECRLGLQEGVTGGGEGTHIVPQLVLHLPDGGHTKTFRKGITLASSIQIRYF